MRRASQRHVLYWLGLLLAVVAVVAVLQGILLPFIASLGIAYLFDPVVDRLTRAGMSRFLAVVVLSAALVLVTVLVLLFVLPLVFDQLQNLWESRGDFQTKMQELLGGLQTFLSERLGVPVPDIEAAVARGFADLGGTVGKTLPGSTLNIIGTLWSGSLALVNFLSLLFVTPVISFFMLLDWDRMVEKVDSWLPRDHAPTIRRLGREVNEVLAGFVRGQLTVSLLLGIFYAIGLEIIGLNNALLIGLVSGLICIVPFVGSLTGTLVATLVAFSQFWPDQPWSIAAVIVTFVIGQVLEGNFLSPKIVGERVNLHPVWLIFALFVMGYLFGLVGLLVAVPLAAAVGVVARFAVGEYLKSPLYLGEEEAGAAAGDDPAGGAGAAQAAVEAPNGEAPSVEPPAVAPGVASPAVPAKGGRRGPAGRTG
ncbi:MAG: AI-2E family transporter [Hyphomicrobiaceae bacterium]